MDDILTTPRNLFLYYPSYSMVGYSSIEDVILTILAVLVIVILVGTIYSIIRAIIMFIFSNGDNEKIKKAWNGIRHTIIGLIITIFLLFVFPIIFQRVSQNGGTMYTASAIVGRAMLIGRKILSLGSYTGTTRNGSNSNNTRTIDGGNDTSTVNGPL